MYSVSVARGNTPKKTPPTTVRFTKDLHVWVKERGDAHKDGQSGVINDAVAHYKAHLEERASAIHKAILGGSDG